MTALKKRLAQNPSISVKADSDFLVGIPFPGFMDAAAVREYQKKLDTDVDINRIGGLTSTMLPPAPEPEPTPPAKPVEREISLAEILQAVAKSKDDIASLLSGGDVSPSVQAVLSAMLNRFEHVEKNAQSFVYGNAVVASAERTLSALPQYSDEKIAEMRRLRAEVEEMVRDFKKVEKSRDSADLKEQRKVDILRKYGVQKWTRATYGHLTAGCDFLTQHYKRWLDAGVIFKDDLRHIESALVKRIENEVLRGSVAIDPIPTRDVRTNKEAVGLLAVSGERQSVAKSIVSQRSAQRDLQRLRRQEQHPRL